MAAKPYLTPNEAAELLMVAPATLRIWADKGLIRAHTTAGGHRRFMKEDLARFQQAMLQADSRTKQGASRRILIVDDDASLTRYLCALLGSYPGVVTEVAHDGFTAGQRVHTFQPDTLLLDLMMPGLDGFQVCTQIKAAPQTRAIRIIAITGFPSPENLARILAAGAEACLDKPLDETLLLSKLELTLHEEGRS